MTRAEPDARAVSVLSSGPIVERTSGQWPSRSRAQQPTTRRPSSIRPCARSKPKAAASTRWRPRCVGRLGTAFIAAIELIRAAQGRVIVTGMGKSGHVARKIASTFASTGTPALFVHPGEASHGDLGMIASNDVIIALSWSGETAELKNLTDYSRRFRIGLIAMTASANSTLAKAADVVLAMPQAREACPHNLAPTTSSLDSACARRRAGDRAAGKPRLHGGAIRPAASRRQARHAAQAGARPHA